MIKKQQIESVSDMKDIDKSIFLFLGIYQNLQCASHFIQLQERMKIIVWLGNPGKKYETTRHNIGFILADLFGTDWKEDKKSQAFTTLFGKTLFIKPQTFMNLSGECVQKMVNFYKLDPTKDILVLSDDLDMEFGKVRYRKKWSHGGQNGLKDIIEKLGTDEFARIKVGIWRNPQYSVSDWVLSRFTEAEIKMIKSEIFDNVKRKIQEWLDESKE